jgi:hypothetical protein
MPRGNRPPSGNDGEVEVGVATGGAAGTSGRGPRLFRRLPGCRPAQRCWPRRLPSSSRSPLRPWLPPAGPPAGPRGPGTLWSPRSCRGPSGGTAHADAATITATRRGGVSQASRLSATRVIGPREESRPAMRPGSSAAGSRERGHHPPSTTPVPAIAGSSCSPAAPAAPSVGWVERWWGCWWLRSCRRLRSRFRMHRPVGNGGGSSPGVPGGCPAVEVADAGLRDWAAVRRLVLGWAVGWGRAGGSAGPMLAHRTSSSAGGCGGRAGWWRR